MKNQLRNPHSPLWWIALPVLLTALYLGLIAKDRFVSESSLIVKRADFAAPSGGSVSLLQGGGPATSPEDVLYLKDYLLSPDMLQHLDAELDFRQAFAESGADLLQRLPQDVDKEDLLDYYRRHVEVRIDTLSGVLTLRTQGFTPEFAHRFNQAALQQAERFINEMSQRIATEQMRFAGEELERARTSLEAARQRLIDYQGQHNVLDPEVRAQTAARMISDMEIRLAQMEAELRNLLTYLNSSAPQVIALQNGIQALKAQIDAEKKKQTSGSDARINRMAAEFADLKADVDYQADFYKMTLSAVEKTRIEAARKVKSLAVLSQPTLPDSAAYPRKIYNLLSVLFMASLIFGLYRLIRAIIEDHRD